MCFLTTLSLIPSDQAISLSVWNAVSRRHSS